MKTWKIGARLFAIGLLLVPSSAAIGQAPPSTPLVPPGLHWENAAFDAARSQLVLVGGTGPTGYLKGTWAWDGIRWSIAADSAATPSPRHAHAMGFDPEMRRVVLFGGQHESNDQSVPVADRAKSFCDTWGFDGRAWSRINDGPCITNRTSAGSIVYDTRRRALLLLDGPPSPPNDVAPRPLKMWRLAGNSWQLVDSTGPRRGGGSSGGVAYDEARGVLVVPLLDGPDAGVWEWNGQSWRRVTVSGPIPRRSYGITYDPRLRRVLLVGGLAGSPRRALGDVWTWDGAAWTELPAAGGAPPGPRSHATLLNDERGGRLLYFGGTADGKLLQEIWSFGGSDGWRQWRP